MLIYYFFAPWCGYCKQFTPTWEKVKSKHGHKIAMKEINIEDKQNKKLMTDYNVTGFPTVIVVDGEHWLEYRGQRTVKDLEDFVKLAIKNL